MLVAIMIIITVIKSEKVSSWIPFAETLVSSTDIWRKTKKFGRATVNTGGIQSSKYSSFSLAEICSLSDLSGSLFFPFVSSGVLPLLVSSFYLN